MGAQNSKPKKNEEDSTKPDPETENMKIENVIERHLNNMEITFLEQRT